MEQKNDLSREIHPERINYTIDSGKYVAYSVNVPGIIVQANTKEEMEMRVKQVFQSFMKMMTETLSSENPFDFRELSNDEWSKQP